MLRCMALQGTRCNASSFSDSWRKNCLLQGAAQITSNMMCMQARESQNHDKHRNLQKRCMLIESRMLIHQGNKAYLETLVSSPQNPKQENQCRNQKYTQYAEGSNAYLPTRNVYCPMRERNCRTIQWHKFAYAAASMLMLSSMHMAKAIRSAAMDKHLHTCILAAVK